MSSVLPLNILDFCLEIRLTVEKAGRPPIHLMTMWHELGGLELSPLWLRPTQADVNPAQNYPEPPHSLTYIAHRPCFPLLAQAFGMVPSPFPVVFTNLTDPSSMSRAMEVACTSGEQTF